MPNTALAIAMKMIALTSTVSRNELRVKLTAMTPAMIRADDRRANIQLSKLSALRAFVTLTPAVFDWDQERLCPAAKTASAISGKKSRNSTRDHEPCKME